jgi:hypothetical protein
MKYLTAIEAKQFAEKWLPAWSGNHPELLAGFYSEDAFTLIRAFPEAFRGKIIYWLTSGSCRTITAITLILCPPYFNSTALNCWLKPSPGFTAPIARTVFPLTIFHWNWNHGKTP